MLFTWDINPIFDGLVNLTIIHRNYSYNLEFIPLTSHSENTLSPVSKLIPI